MALRAAFDSAKRLSDRLVASDDPSLQILATASMCTATALAQAALDLWDVPREVLTALTGNLNGSARLVDATLAAGDSHALDAANVFVGAMLYQKLGAVADCLAELADRSEPAPLEASSRTALKDASEQFSSGINLEMACRVATLEALRSELLPDGAESLPEGGASFQERTRGAQDLLQQLLREESLTDAEARAPIVTGLLELLARSGSRSAAGSSTNTQAGASGGQANEGDVPFLDSRDRALVQAVVDVMVRMGTPAAEDAGGGADGAGSGQGAAAQAGDGGRRRRQPLPKSFLCPVMQVIMRDPVTTATGHTYERAAIESWLRDHDTDPLTKQRLPHKTLVPAWAFKGAIEEWLAAAGITHDEYDELGDDFDDEQPAGPAAPRASGGRWEGGSRASARESGDTATAAAAGPTAYGIFAGVTSWDEVSDMDQAAKEHLRANRVTPAIARAMTEVLGPVAMADLAAGLVEEAHVEALCLKPLDHRRVLEAMKAARQSQAAGQQQQAAVPAISIPLELQRPAQLLDYVTVAPGYKDVHDAASGPLEPGGFGVVLMDDRTDKPLQVRSLQPPYRMWWYGREALQPVSISAIPAESRLQIAPANGPPGAPVTPFTASAGLLVRRGYGWAQQAGSQADQELLGQIGMLIKTETNGQSWAVFWTGGSASVMSTGHDNKFELQHLRAGDLGLAPVVFERRIIPGSAVVRGLHWTWGDQDGGVDSVGSLQPDEQDGAVAALWPNHRLYRYRAKTSFDLYYAQRRGEPVTVYNAVPGLLVTRGRDWRWASQDDDGGVGRLMAPVVCGNSGIWWKVRWPSGQSNRYRVGRPGLGDCDLQLSTYDSAGSSGAILSGTPVVLAPDFESFSDAADGPLKEGSVGVAVTSSGGRVQVLHLRTQRQWWYDRPALRPLPGQLAVARYSCMVLNRDGRAAFLGAGVGTGGDTGRENSELFYCGAMMDQCRCGRCDGQCGPSNGCPCHACVELTGKRVQPDGSLGDSGEDPAAVRERLTRARRADGDAD